MLAVWLICQRGMTTLLPLGYFEEWRPVQILGTWKSICIILWEYWLLPFLVVRWGWWWWRRGGERSKGRERSERRRWKRGTWGKWRRGDNVESLLPAHLLTKPGTNLFLASSQNKLMLIQIPTRVVLLIPFCAMPKVDSSVWMVSRSWCLKVHFRRDCLNFFLHFVFLAFPSFVINSPFLESDQHPSHFSSYYFLQHTMSTFCFRCIIGRKGKKRLIELSHLPGTNSEPFW